MWFDRYGTVGTLIGVLYFNYLDRNTLFVPYDVIIYIDTNDVLHDSKYP